MKKTISGTTIAFLTLLPWVTFAHEHQMFEINGDIYEFVIGSLGEPIVVDDKTGVDLRIAKKEGRNKETSVPISGLQESLKVELIAADKKKVLEFSPVYDTPGAYKASFFPTVATTLSYRVFGELEGTPIDLTFTCNPAGHAPEAENTSRVQISDSVVRTLKSGSFGCPAEKAVMGFPEVSASIMALKERDEKYDVSSLGAGALAVSALVVAFMRRRQ